jgi:hypothetical protein
MLVILEGEMERNIAEVIEAIKTLIPKAEDPYFEYPDRLDRIVTSSFYTAPEAMHIRWGELGALLTELSVGLITPPWLLQIGRIVRGEEDLPVRKKS